MPPVLAAALCFVTYVLFYRFYARHLGSKVFKLDPNAITPAHAMKDGIDYVPARKDVLFGHHYASIAGLAPMLGPAIAVIWGWLPGMVWVVLGTLLVGAVHDFSALVVSMRNKGMSIGKVAEDLIGKRAKSLFLLIILFLICLVMGVFVGVVADLFTSAFYPEAVFPTFFLMAVAMVIGWLVYKKGASVSKTTAVGFTLMMLSVAVALNIARPDLARETWIMILLVYAFAASVLPVWALLQPRDYLNSLLLYLGLGAAFIGFFLLRPEFVAPVLDMAPADAPPIFPFVFIVIACGAASGFHGLVSSGTTSKQISKETDAVAIGYGGMVGESLLGLLAVLATTAGFRSTEAWSEHYSSWTVANGLADKMEAFIRRIGSVRHYVGCADADRSGIHRPGRGLLRVDVARLGHPVAPLQYRRDRQLDRSTAACTSLHRFGHRRCSDRVLRVLRGQRPTRRSGALGPVRKHQPGACRSDAVDGYRLPAAERVELLVHVPANGFHAVRNDHGHGLQPLAVLQRGSVPAHFRSKFHLCSERVAGD